MILNKRRSIDIKKRQDEIARQEAYEKARQEAAEKARQEAYEKARQEAAKKTYIIKIDNIEYIKVNELLDDYIKVSERLDYKKLEFHTENDIKIDINSLKEIKRILTDYKENPEKRPERVTDKDLKCDNKDVTKFFYDENCLLSVDNYNAIMEDVTEETTIEDVLKNPDNYNTSGGRKKRRTTKKRRTIKKKSRKNKLRKSKVNKKCK